MLRWNNVDLEIIAITDLSCNNLACGVVTARVFNDVTTWCGHRGGWPMPNDRGATFTLVAVWPRCHLDAASHLPLSRGFGGFECGIDSEASEG